MIRPSASVTASPRTKCARSGPKGTPSAAAFYWRGRSYFRQQALAEAVADLSQAVIWQPQNADHYFWRGRAQYDLHDYTAALRNFDQAMALRPGNSNDQLWRGIARYRLGYLPAALADLTRAYELAPGDPLRCAWLGRAYLALDDPGRAAAEFKKVAVRLGEDGQPAYIVAAGYAAHGDLARTSIWLRLALNRTPHLLASLAQDPDFDPVRAAEPYQSLLDEFAAPA